MVIRKTSETCIKSVRFLMPSTNQRFTALLTSSARGSRETLANQLPMLKISIGGDRNLKRKSVRILRCCGLILHNVVLRVCVPVCAMKTRSCRAVKKGWSLCCCTSVSTNNIYKRYAQGDDVDRTEVGSRRNVRQHVAHVTSLPHNPLQNELYAHLQY